MTRSWIARRAVRDAKDGELTDVSPGASQLLSAAALMKPGNVAGLATVADRMKQCDV